MADLKLTTNLRFLLVLTAYTLCVANAASTGNYTSGGRRTADDPPMAYTEYGPVQGVYLREFKEVRAFLGIPFAEPPVGELRWQPPQTQKAWDGVYQAVKQPVGCPQGCGEPEFACPPGVSMAFEFNCKIDEKFEAILYGSRPVGCWYTRFRVVRLVFLRAWSLLFHDIDRM